MYKKQIVKTILVLSCGLMLMSCGRKMHDENAVPSNQYAQGFSIFDGENYTKIVVLVRGRADKSCKRIIWCEAKKPKRQKMAFV